MFSQILMVFIILRFAQYFLEKNLSRLNRKFYLNVANQKEAQQILGISDDDMQKSLAYATDRYMFARVSGWLNITLFMLFLTVGGLGWVEQGASQLLGAYADDEKILGITVFGMIGVITMIYGIPFSYYHTFVVEERHGFNRQTRKGFFTDLLKGLLLGAILGGGILWVLLLIMTKAGDSWWILAWAALSGFSIITAWLYPALLAPLFNKFSPLQEGPLKEGIYELAKKIHFKTNGLFIMDASKRSSHGNAYFTGMFGKKRIVLFDTLIDTLKVKEIIAVLAHELGHFKLNHVRWMLLRSVLMTGLTFYLLSLCLHWEEFYTAFGLKGVTSYGALIVFSLWFSLLDFLLQPMESYLSRRNEFAADRFALDYIEDKSELGTALLKMREKSHSLPISHPLFSAFYYSHPPIIERLKAMKV